MHLNIATDLPTVPTVLAAVLDTIAVEKATRITPTADATPCAVHEEIDRLLPEDVEKIFVDRFDFYDLARAQDLALCVVTGDIRRFANVLLTIGVLPR